MSKLNVICPECYEGVRVPDIFSDGRGFAFCRSIVCGDRNSEVVTGHLVPVTDETVGKIRHSADAMIEDMCEVLGR